MGKRSTIEATAGILNAFLRCRTWKQAELARELELTSRTLKHHLTELARSGLPLERQEEPPQVYWSVPKGWFPGGLLLETEHAELLVELLCRMPASKERDVLVRRIASGLPHSADQVTKLESVIHGVGSEATYTALVTESALTRTALRFHYFSTSRGALEWRHASVQRVLPGPPARIVAVCHRSKTLKWFRVDSIVDAQLDPTVPYQPAVASELHAYFDNSLDGFATPSAVTEHRFFVAEPDARWVGKNLIPPMIAQTVSGGIRVSCRTTAMLRLARFVLGLAPVAQAETPELAALVTQLAEATLARHERAKPLMGPPESARLEARLGTSPPTHSKAHKRARSTGTDSKGGA